MDGELSWIHSDHLHSASVHTDKDGNEVRRLAYRAFGEELENQGSGAAPTYSYTGKERDRSGLMYYGARYYDPALSRFITADTVYDAGPQGLNRYAYALNNPIRYNDPSGHQVLSPEEHDTLALGMMEALVRLTGVQLEAAEQVDEFIAEYGDEIGDGLEQVGEAMDVAGTEMIKGGLATSASGGACMLTTAGTCAVAGVPAVTGGLVATGAGILTKMTGNAIEQTGGHLKNEARSKKRASSSSAGLEEAPQLKRLHKDSTLKKDTLDYWRNQSTEDIVESLKRSGPERLRVRPDGTVRQGNHRVKILEDRGYDTSQLFEYAEVEAKEVLAPWE